MASPLLDIASEEQFNSTVASGKVVVHFWAQWCEPCKDLDKILIALSSKYPNIKFARLEAEQVENVAEKQQISIVPYFLFFSNGQVVNRVEGASPQDLMKGVQALESTVSVSAPAATATSSSQNSEEALNERLKKLVSRAPVMLFMKGSPEQPKCGFSNKIVQILQKNNIKFDSFDILSDEDVRQGLKKFSNWPTFPQLYSSGKLVGGLDIVKELDETGSLLDEIGIEEAETEEQLNKRLEKLVSRAPVMLFMKGAPAQPKCGFSRQIVQILEKNNVKFDSFDILADEVVRQGLKKYSNWPTYPQLYSKGKLVGGLDIVKELESEGELLDALE